MDDEEFLKELEEIEEKDEAIVKSMKGVTVALLLGIIGAVIFLMGT